MMMMMMVMAAVMGRLVSRSRWIKQSERGLRVCVSTLAGLAGDFRSLSATSASRSVQPESSAAGGGLHHGLRIHD